MRISLPRRAALGVLGVVGLTAALATMSGCSSAPESTVAHPERARDIAIPRDGQVIEARVPPRATLESLLRGHDVPADLTSALVTSVRAVFNPRDLRVDQTYRISRTLDGFLNEFWYRIDADRILKAVRQNRAGQPAFDVEVVPVPRSVATDAVVATISREHSSLVGALEAAGEDITLALDLADLFGGVIDFNSDLQPGDRLEVLFERITREGGPSTPGKITAAALVADGRRFNAIGFAGADGKVAYYDEQGRSLKRQFLKSPLPFQPRVTSGFSYRRLHPVKGGIRPHLGVDYGAPSGTAVQAVADGVVESAGWNGDAGRMIRLRHPGGYETLYLHLSSISAAVRPGARVAQGDVIGRVGMTGSATGPHLDYRIVKNGVYVNPLVEHSRMPSAEPLSGAALASFGPVRDRVIADLESRVAAAAAASASTGARTPAPAPRAQ
jgi:murein DD-endopeptidase MepM/ murein hydrolase activator NlpD